MRRIRFVVSCSCLLLSLTVLASRGSAANIYWDGSASSSWVDLDNWSTVIAGGTNPAAIPGTGDRVYFNASTVGNAITTLGAAQAVQGLVFNSNAASGITLGTLNDFTLTLGNSVGIVVQSGTHVINSSLITTATQTWNNTGTGTLTLAGDVALNSSVTWAGTGGISITGTTTAASSRSLTINNTASGLSLGAVVIGSGATLTVNTAPTATLTIDGIVSGASLTKDGEGTLILNGANSFTGNLRIVEGLVKVNTSNTAASQIIFGNASGAAGSDGFGTLTLDTNSAVSMRLASLTYVHPTSDGAIINAGGGGSFVPALELLGNRTFIVNDTASANDLVVEVGIVNGDATARSLTKNSIGTMVMRGANTYTGDTNIDRGVLVLDYSMNNSDSRLSNTGVLNLRGGSLELWGNASAASSESIGSLALTRSNASVALVSNGHMVTLNILGGFTRTTGSGVINFSLNDPAMTQVIATGGAVNNAFGILGGWASVNDRWATKDGSSQIVGLAGTVQNNKSLWTAADHVVVDGAATGTLATSEVASLILDNPAGGTLTLNNAGGALTLAAGALMVSADVGANDTTIGPGQLMTRQNTGAQSTEMIVTNNSAGTLTLNAGFGGSNTPQSLQAINLTLAGPGLIVLAGSNNLIGHTSAGSNSQTSQVNIVGQVRVTGGNGLPDYGGVALATGGAAPVGALLDINGGTEGVGNLTGGAGGDNTYAEVGRGEVRLGAGGVLTLNQTAASTLSAQITGSNALLIKKGSATFTTTTNVEHTMTGEIRVLGGLLDLTGGAAGFTSINTVRLRGGQLRVEQNQTGTNIPNKINNAAALILEGTSGDGFRITSNQNLGRSETLASLGLGSSASVITLDNTAAATDAALTSLVFGAATDSFTRANGATMLVRGPNLGGAASASTDATRVVFSTPAAISSHLAGTSSTAGAKNLKILAFAIGENSPTGAGNTFLTVDSAAGNSLRTLTDSEYGLDYALADPDFNLSLSAGAGGLGTKTLNALRVVASGGNVTLSGSAGSTLTLASGGLLITAGATDNDVTIGGYDAIKAGTSGSGADELVVHITSSHATPSGATLTLQSAIVDNGGATSLTKTGAGTLVLTGANTYTGETTVNQGVLEFGAAGAGNLGGGLVRVAGGTLRWGAGNTTDITAGGRSVELLGASVYLTPNYGGYILDAGSTFDVGANNVTLTGAIGASGHGGLTKTGAGTLTLNAAPTYTGVTVVNQGALNFQTIAAGTTEALYLIQTAGITSGTISSTVQSGLNLQSLVVGGVYGSDVNMAATLTVLGGAVNIGDGGGDDFILIGYRDATAGVASSAVPLANTSGTVNFSAAASVSINVGQIQMGIYNGGVPSPNSRTTTGGLTLSNGTNVIIASSILMGSAPSSVVNTGTASTLQLGSGSTTINVDTFTVGGIRSKADVTIGAGGSFTLRGQQGGDTGANLFIGDNDTTGTGTPNVSSFNLTGASHVDMRLNLLVLGRLGASTNGGYGRGTLTYGVGTILADTIRMADANYTSAGTNPQNTQGTITQSGTASMRFRDLSQGAGTATYNWQGGTIGNITATNLTNQNVTVTLNGAGTATDASLRTFDVEAGQTATFEAEAGIAGTGSYTKAGGGQLIYKGVNTQSGNVRVSAGSIALVAGGSMDDAAWVNVESGASFDISQRTGAAYTSDAVISGNGTIGGTGATFTVGSNVGAVNSVGVLKPGGSSVLSSAANATTVGNQTGTLNVQGNLILAASGGVRVDRAELQIGTTNRNASSTFATYGGNATTWVDNIVTDFAAFLTGSGTGHDRVDIAGSLTLNNTGGIGVALNGGYTGVFGDVFNLMDWTGIVTNNGFTTGDRIRTGGEAGVDLALPTLAAGLAWDTSLFQSHGVIVVVPEPGRGVLLLLAGLAFTTRRRRR